MNFLSEAKPYKAETTIGTIPAEAERKYHDNESDHCNIPMVWLTKCACKTIRKMTALKSKECKPWERVKRSVVMNKVVFLWVGLLLLNMPTGVSAGETKHAQTKMGEIVKHQAVTHHAKRHKAAKIILKNSTQKLSYAFGMQVGDSFKQGNMDMDMDRFLLGFQHTIEGQKPLLSEKTAKKFRDQFYDKKRQLLAEKNLGQAKIFMAKNSKKKGVQVTSSGLQYLVLRKGYGAHPETSAIVRVQYSAQLSDGTEFYSTYKKGRSVVLPVKGVIRGLGEAFELMTVGSHYRFFMPPKLAYGEHGSGNKIEPNVALVYDVELLAIESPKF